MKTAGLEQAVLNTIWKRMTIFLLSLRAGDHSIKSLTLIWYFQVIIDTRLNYKGQVEH